MNCARHLETAAIGMCCNCGRGVCALCKQSESSPKLVCSPEYGKRIAEHDDAIGAILAKTNRGSEAAGVYTIALGIGAMILGFYHLLFDFHGVLVGIGFTAGVIFCVTGVVLIRVGRMK